MEYNQKIYINYAKIFTFCQIVADNYKRLNDKSYLSIKFVTWKRQQIFKPYKMILKHDLY